MSYINESLKQYRAGAWEGRIEQAEQQVEVETEVSQEPKENEISGDVGSTCNVA